ncbi:MAG: efflux RND transporter permease subunit [Burkholderiales bacterium]
MNLSTWSIRNPIPTLLLFLLFTGLGFMSFKAMKIQNFPDIDLPTVSVSAALPGAAPSQLETEVARKIEASIATVTGVKHIYTRVQEGLVTVTVEFKLEKSLSDASDDVRDAVGRVRADLPADLRDPIITRFDLAGVPILTYSIASDRMDEEALSWFVDNTVAKTILAVPGVGKVGRVGGATREIRVEIDPSRLAALNVTVAEISRQLKRVQQEASGGRSDLGGAEQALRTIATVQSAQELASLQIPLNDGRRVRLDQVALVKDTVAERRSGAFLNGKPVVGFEITRSRGASEITVADGVRRVLAQMKADHPGIEITEAFNFVEPVHESYVGSMTLLFEGGLLAIIVVFFFLRDWRATLVAAVALPLSVIPTFVGMHWLGFSINVVTLLSLALVVGVLVDDAIVEIENIVRHLGLGKSPRDAAMEAVEEIGLAVVATTFTLIAVFLPTAFMSGVAGRFFVQFGWTAAIAVFVSLVVARLLTPMMAAHLLRPISKEPKVGKVMTWYLGLAAWCIRHRFITAILAALFFFGSLALIPLLPTGFIPPDDLAQTQVKIELPSGSTFEQTAERAEQARVLLAKNPDVRLIYTAIGGGATGSDPFAPGGAPEARKATLLINLTPRDERDQSKQQIEAALRDAVAAVPGIRSTVGFGGAGEKLVLAFTGDDGDILARAARAVERDLRSIPGIGNIVSTASLTRPELIVRPDSGRAADLGVTAAAINDTLRIATAGDFDQGLAKLNLAQRQVPIVVRLSKSARQDISVIERLAVPGKAGNVMLASVADIAFDTGPSQIDRYDRSRNIFVEVELNGRALGEVLAEAEELAAVKQLPPGVKRAELGDVEGMKELFESFGLAMLTGVFCIYIVLVLLFKDFVQPVTILAALPLSIGGAFGALLIAGKAMSMPSLIGLIMLMGVATKNSILLVEYAIVARRDLGMSRTEALLDACGKRARPIIMTTLAMGGGMLPIALGWGVDPSFRSPMAVAVIGGLITSTLLSLLVIPVVFTYVDDAVNLVNRAWRWVRPAHA